VDTVELTGIGIPLPLLALAVLLVLGVVALWQRGRRR